MTFTPKAFQRPPPPITRADTPLPTLQQQIREQAARQNEQRADESAQRLRGFFAGQPTDPAVGLNPTGRARRPSASSRRKHARRTATEETP